jgi:tRNA pseudouridine38-40 synthase
VRTNVNARTYVYLLPISILGTTLPIEEIVAKANRVCSFFKGSHKFHNYTELGDPKKAEMRRFILSFEC